MKIKDKNIWMKICIGAIIVISIVLCICLIPRKEDKKGSSVADPTEIENEVDKDSNTDKDLSDEKSEPMIELEDDVFENPNSENNKDDNNQKTASEKNDNTNTGDQGGTDAGNNGDSDNADTGDSEKDDKPSTDSVVLPEVPIP